MAARAPPATAAPRCSAAACRWVPPPRPSDVDVVRDEGRRRAGLTNARTHNIPMAALAVAWASTQTRPNSHSPRHCHPQALYADTGCEVPTILGECLRWLAQRALTEPPSRVFAPLPTAGPAANVQALRTLYDTGAPSPLDNVTEPHTVRGRVA